MRKTMLAALLAATTLQAAPRRVATILVRADQAGTIHARRDGSDRYARLRHLGWQRALRPPGVCIRTALQDGVPAWVQERPGQLPVVWDARGLRRYMDHWRRTGYLPVDPPRSVPHAARLWLRSEPVE